jgi:hypothetical protein
MVTKTSLEVISSGVSIRRLNGLRASHERSVPPRWKPLPSLTEFSMEKDGMGGRLSFEGTFGHRPDLRLVNYRCNREIFYGCRFAVESRDS